MSDFSEWGNDWYSLIIILIIVNESFLFLIDLIDVKCKKL